MGNRTTNPLDWPLLQQEFEPACASRAWPSVWRSSRSRRARPWKNRQFKIW